MDPFPPEDGLVVWLGTNPKSRKAQEIKDNPSVTLYYADPTGNGYVTIIGTAVLINDPKEKAKRWQEGWEAFFPDRDESYLLIKVMPVKMEVVNYKHQITGDSKTWSAPSVEF